MKHEARVFEITSPTKKISLNYDLNKVSKFNYYLWDVKCAWCAWSYHLTAAWWQFLNIHQLMSRCYLACLSVLSEHVASQSKWQSADLDLLKLAKRKIVWTALFLGKVCIWCDKIANVSAILGRKSTAGLKVNQNTRSPPLSENLKFKKRMGFSGLFLAFLYE